MRAVDRECAVTGPTHNPHQGDVFDDVTAHRSVAARLSVRDGVEDEELTVGDRHRCPLPTVCNAEGNGGHPRPRQERLHKPLEPGDRVLPRIRSNQVGALGSKLVHQRVNRVRLENHISVHEHQHRRIGCRFG